MKRYLSFCILFCISCSFLFSQYRSTERACILCSVDAGAGWYMPSLGYLNDESYLSDIGGAFDGGLMYVGALEAKVYGNFLAGLQAGYWSNSVSVENAGTFNAQWNEELSLTIIPITVFGKYEFNLPASKRLFPFLGAGFTMNFVSQDLNREVGGVVTETDLSGRSSTIAAIVGSKFAITSHVDFGLEYNYVLGGFDQTFIENGVESTQNVGLDGSLILGKISFTIDDRLNPSRKYRSGSRRKYKPGKRRKGSFKKPKRRGASRKSSYKRRGRR